MFKVSKTKFKGLLIFEGEIHKDKRGYLRELIVEKNVKVLKMSTYETNKLI